MNQSIMTAIQKTINRLSTTTSTTSTSNISTRSFTTESINNNIQPNRMTRTFTQMKKECPNVIQKYATCVLQHQSMGTLEKNCCIDEFQDVKDCFRSVRRR